MNGLPYYKAYPRDFIEGTIGMPFELKCAYRVILDLIYMQGGNLPDDARYISGLLGCTVRKWKSLREQLVNLGKIDVNGEFLTNKRAVSELETLAKLQDNQREKRARPNKNKEIKSPQCHQPEPDTEPEKKEPKGSQKAAAQEAVEIWNAIAGPAGLPECKKLNASRLRHIPARVAEYSIDGWKAACVRLAASAFCRGENDRGWRADIDFLASDSGFTKVIEGKYDDRSGTDGRTADRRRAWAELIDEADGRSPAGDAGSLLATPSPGGSDTAPGRTDPAFHGSNRHLR